MSVLVLDLGYTVKYTLCLQARGYIWPYIPRLVLIWIQYLLPLVIYQLSANCAGQKCCWFRKPHRRRLSVRSKYSYSHFYIRMTFCHYYKYTNRFSFDNVTLSLSTQLWRLGLVGIWKKCLGRLFLTRNSLRNAPINDQ